MDSVTPRMWRVCMYCQMAALVPGLVEGVQILCKLISFRKSISFAFSRKNDSSLAISFAEWGPTDCMKPSRT